ncbi:MAG TPA: hypothetical protein ENH53_01770 [Bacteroidetes bacterium]|nr:hypothetical protein [Bacteroidota bacterium]
MHRRHDILNRNAFPEIVTFLWTGNLSCSAIKVDWRPEIEKPPALRVAEDNFWETLRRKNPLANLFNGRLAELRDYRISADHIYLNLQPSDYRAFMYSNAHRQEILQKYGKEFINQGLGISAIVRTEDGRIMLMRRSETVGEYPGKLDVFGGHIEIGRPLVNGTPDPCLAMREELHEELNLETDEILNLRLIGLLRNAETAKPELVFLAEIALRLKALQEKAASAADRGEYSALLALPDETNAIRNYLKDRSAHFSPSGFGSLWLYSNIERLGIDRL